MLGAATRAASGLVRQSIAGNVSKALPAVANRKCLPFLLVNDCCQVMDENVATEILICRKRNRVQQLQSNRCKVLRRRTSLYSIKSGDEKFLVIVITFQIDAPLYRIVSIAL